MITVVVEYSKTTFVTVNQKGETKCGLKRMNSKTTFVTVNLLDLLFRLFNGVNSKTTFVTVNQRIKVV